MWINAVKQEMDHKNIVCQVRFCILLPPPTTFHPSNMINGVQEEKTQLSHKHQTFQIDIGFITSFVNFLFYVAIFTKFGRIAEFKVLPAMALKVSFLRAILALLSPNDWDPLAPWVPNQFA